MFIIEHNMQHESYLRKVYLANRVHEILAKIWMPAPLRWHHKTANWKYNSNLQTAFVLSSILSKGVGLLASLAILLYGRICPETLTRSQTVSFSMIIVGISLLFICEYIIIQDGRELATCCNWAFQKQQWIERYGKTG